jgi:predicted sulfurtransferase
LGGKKFLDDLPPDKAFKDLDLFPVQEIVHYGISPETSDKIAHLKGEHLPAPEYHRMMEKSDTVIIDVRNTYESVIGRFQPPSGGAEFIDPNMRRSTDFQAFLESDETKEKLSGKNVMMYCTGGVRCERASAMLRFKMGDSVGRVVQLQGGIEKYMKTFPEGGHWVGKNFAFDKRNANSAGEMWEPPAGTKEDPEILESAVCVVCKQKEDKYQGHRKCSDCAVPVIVCDRCRSAKADTTRRCTLCEAEFWYLTDFDGAVARQVEAGASEEQQQQEPTTLEDPAQFE